MAGPFDAPGLAPITLDELTAVAALQTRVDRKYVLRRADAALLLDLLPRDTRVLAIDGRRRFEYASLYLDTAELTSYRMTAQRRRRRFKVRIRQYRDTGSTWLEVKTRRGRHTVKDRLLLPAGASVTARLDGGTAGFVREVLDDAGVPGIDPAVLAPVLHTGYRRTTLYLPDSRSRVTVDTSLSFAAAADGRTLAVPQLAVVETKTSSTPSGVDRILWSLGIRPARISKYGTGLAALHPELPQTRWRRLIRNQFVPDLPDPHLPGGPDLADLALLRSAS